MAVLKEDFKRNWFPSSERSNLCLIFTLVGVHRKLQQQRIQFELWVNYMLQHKKFVALDINPLFTTAPSYVLVGERAQEALSRSILYQKHGWKTFPWLVIGSRRLAVFSVSVAFSPTQHFHFEEEFFFHKILLSKNNLNENYRFVAYWI